MGDPADWLLTDAERGNAATSIPAWTEGNLVEQLVGRVAHRRHDHDDVVAVLLGRDDALGHPLDVRSGGDGGATVLLDDQGHGSQGYRRGVDDPSDWLLTGEQRGNPATQIPPWTTGNQATQ